MKEFFEINLPETLSYLHGDIAKRYEDVVSVLKKRTELLNEAQKICTFSAELFALNAKVIFDMREDFDTLSPSELAEAVVMLGEREYSPRREWTEAEVVIDTAFCTTSEWETIRLCGLGGSDSAVTMGLSPYRTGLDLFYEKTGTPAISKSVDKGKQFLFSYGHKLESLVIETFCDKSGAKIIPETRMFRSKKYPFITANIDGIVEFADGRMAILEAKTTNTFNRVEWSNERIPVQYMSQCRQYTFVLNDERIIGTYIACIYGNTLNDFVCHFIERDKDEEAKVVEAERTFWQYHVLTGNPPAESGDPVKDTETYERYNPVAKVNTNVSLSPENFGNVFVEYEEIKAKKAAKKREMDALDSREKQLRLELEKGVGEAMGGECTFEDKVYTATWSYRKKTTIDTDKLATAYPDAFNDCVTVNPTATKIFSLKSRNAS